MTRYIAKRILYMIPVLLGVTLLDTEGEPMVEFLKA